MTTYKQLELFPEFGSETIETEVDKLPIKGIFAHNNRFLLSLCENVNFTSTFGMPVVAGCTISAPQDIYGFYRLGNRNIVGVLPHFYTTDSRLIPFLREPYQHLSKLDNHPVILGIDISIKPEMPIPMKIAISFFNKLIMAWWHYEGKTVVPNVIVDQSVADWCLDGYPKHSVISMNSSGIGSDERAKSNWQSIYPQVIDVLEPTLILRYGGKQSNEAENISVYYDNDNKKSKRYGW